MGKKDTIAKVLAIIGTVLLWIPILFTILTSAVGTILSKVFRMDYLMPAELFPVVLVGSILLFIAARRSRIHDKLVGWSTIIMFVFLLGGQALAVITGLASGETEAAGLPWVLVVGALVLYSALLIELCITGAVIVKKLLSKG